MLQDGSRQEFFEGPLRSEAVAPFPIRLDGRQVDQGGTRGTSLFGSFAAVIEKLGPRQAAAFFLPVAPTARPKERLG
jgi:hypothetical protein